MKRLATSRPPLLSPLQSMYLNCLSTEADIAPYPYPLSCPTIYILCSKIYYILGHVWQWLDRFQQCHTMSHFWISDSDCFLDIIQFSDCIHGVTKQSYATHGHMLNPKHTHMFTIYFVLLMFMLFTLCHHDRSQCQQSNHNLWLSLWLAIIWSCDCVRMSQCNPLITPPSWLLFAHIGDLPRWNEKQDFQRGRNLPGLSYILSEGICIV